MEEWNEPKVITEDPMPVFNEENHTYAVGDTILISVTQILQKQGISPSYKFVKKDVLEKAASRGTALHSEIEEYNKLGTMGFSPECLDYMHFVEAAGITPVMSECLVWTDFYAGKFDQLWRMPDGKLVLTDNKFTSSLHVESVTWQLSLYAYAFWKVYGIKVDGIGACWFKDGCLVYKDLMLKDFSEVEALIECQREEKKYTAPYPCDVDVIAEIEYWKQKATEAKAIEDDANSHIKDLQETVISDMREHNTTKFDTGYATFTLSERTTAGKLDKARFKTEHPDIDLDSYNGKPNTTTILLIKLKENN